jgi:hypothetical protein
LGVLIFAMLLEIAVCVAEKPFNADVMAFKVTESSKQITSLGECQADPWRGIERSVLERTNRLNRAIRKCS